MKFAKWSFAKLSLQNKMLNKRKKKLKQKLWSKGKPGKGLVQPKQAKWSSPNEVRQRKFRQMKFAKWSIAKLSSPNEVSPNKKVSSKKGGIFSVCLCLV